jgi:hypothetical protein
MARRFLLFFLLSSFGSFNSDPGLSCVNNIQSESGGATWKVGNSGGNYRELLGVRQNLGERKITYFDFATKTRYWISVHFNYDSFIKWCLCKERPDFVSWDFGPKADDWFSVPTQIFSPLSFFRSNKSQINGCNFLVIIL